MKLLAATSVLYGAAITSGALGRRRGQLLAALPLQMPYG